VPDQLQRLVRPTCRTRHLSRHTAKTYWGWIKRFVVFHDLQHPSRLNAADVNAFLWHLAVDRNVAASTQDQAKNAVVFLDRDVLDIILSLLDVTAALACGLLYGAGLRVDECVSLRIQDLAPASLTVNVRRGKGAKDRVTILPVRG
jgi:site-specific recombinase XerD